MSNINRGVKRLVIVERFNQATKSTAGDCMPSRADKICDRNAPQIKINVKV